MMTQPTPVLFSCRWSVIAAQLPGRTDNEIKNHWHTNLKKRVKQDSVPHEEKHNTNNLAPREKRHKRLKQQPNNSLLNPTTSQIINSSPSSPQPSSSTGSSSISKDSAVVATNSTEAYAETSDNFWTEPFLTDNYSFVSSDLNFLEQQFMDTTEYLSPVFDELFFSPYGLYEEKINSNNLSQIIDSSPSSSSDTAAATSTNMAADDNITSSEAHAEISGNFWTQTFSEDNSYIPNDFLEPLMETECLSPVFDEFLCPYGLCMEKSMY